MSSLALIRSQVEQRVPGGLKVYQQCTGEILQTGIPALDECGMRKGTLTQIWAAQEASSGKTSILVSLLSRLTRDDHFCALVDAGDCFDPVGAEDSGVRLNRLLWIRCAPRSDRRIKTEMKPLEQAFKAADILVQNGGFALIAVDLGNIDVRSVKKVPLTTWFRFARVVEKTETALIFLTSCPVAQSCAALTLQASGLEACWMKAGCTHANVLTVTRHEINGERNRKPPQSANHSFDITSKWA
jgi:recombination protein RecA